MGEKLHIYTSILVKLETKKMKNEIDVKINDKVMNINLKS